MSAKDGARLYLLMTALADHVEGMADEEILEDARAEGLDVEAEGERVRGVLLDAIGGAQ